MPSRSRKFRYRRRSPFPLLARFAADEIDDIDRFVDLAKAARRSEQERLERLAARIRRDAPDNDWLVDDFAQLDNFAALSAEFAILGLWRCVELYRKRAIRFALDEGAAARAFRHKEFQKDLLRLGITETRLRSARSVDELRCLNNAIKHGRRVDGELSDFTRWQSKRGEALGNLESHYARLRSAAERYVSHLTDRLRRRSAP
jgi:hypothetical protein